MKSAVVVFKQIADFRAIAEMPDWVLPVDTRKSNLGGSSAGSVSSIAIEDKRRRSQVSAKNQPLMTP
jgi:hypothetical protein